MEFLCDVLCVSQTGLELAPADSSAIVRADTGRPRDFRLHFLPDQRIIASTGFEHHGWATFAGAVQMSQFLDRLAVLLRFGFSVFQADWIVLKGPLSIVTCIPGSNDDQEERSLRSILSLRSEKPPLIISTRFEDEMVLSAALSE